MTGRKKIINVVWVETKQTGLLGHWTSNAFPKVTPLLICNEYIQQLLQSGPKSLLYEEKKNKAYNLDQLYPSFYSSRKPVL